jgi:hypothetical protein
MARARVSNGAEGLKQIYYFCAWLDDLFGKVHNADIQLNFSKKITDIS